MGTNFLVKEQSIDLFNKKFRPEDDFRRMTTEVSNRDCFFIKNLPELEGCETVTFEILDFGRITDAPVNVTTTYKIEQYDNILLKLVKQ